MGNKDDHELSGPLAEAVAQLIEAPGCDDRPHDLDALVLCALSTAKDRTAVPDSSVAVRSKMGRYWAPFAKYSFAASLFIVVIVVGWLGLMARAQSVYVAVSQRLEKLHSIAYRIQWVDELQLAQVVVGGGDKVTHVRSTHDRIERENGSVVVIDTSTETAIDLNPATKKALVMHGQVAASLAMRSRGPVRLLDTLRKHFDIGRAPADDIEELETRKFGRIVAKGIRSTIDGEIVEAWIDPATNLPLEVRVRSLAMRQVAGAAGPPARMWRVMTDFQYDVPVAPALTSVDVPAGYTAIELPDLSDAMKVSAPSLSDVIDLLRICAQHNDFTFPDSLSMDKSPGTCLAIMTRFADAEEAALTSGTEAERERAIKSVSEFGMALGRAAAFTSTLGSESKFRYVGAGVKLNAPNRPILWFLPEGATHYQVVSADLSVRDVEASALPQQAAEPSNTKRRTVIRSTSPRIVFPRSAVSEYKTLQEFRKAGRQNEVQFLELQWMPEFMTPVATRDSDADGESSRFAFLDEFKRLKGLRLDHLSLTEADLKAIGRCTRLTQLSLSGVQVIETAPGLRRLLGQDLQHLSRLTTLESLDLSQANFVDGLQHLAALPELRTLILSSFENLNDRSITQLKELPHLETLVLAPVYATNPETCVTDAGLASLKQLPHLRHLYIDYHGKWTMPIEKLQALFPGVEVQHGFQKGTTTERSRVPQSPIGGSR